MDTSVGSFKVALATNVNGIRDPAGNLSSFAATAPSDAAAPVRTGMTMLDGDADGKIDTVTVSFSESLASSSATAPWTLANVPSGGTLASVSTGGNTATLALTEGAGAANTAVGSFTVALAANIAGITDAASNQSSFAATAPADGAAPVMVSMLMQDSNSNGKVDRLVTTFSETLNSTSPNNTPWTLANVPSGGTKGALAISTSVATLTITEGAGAADTSVGSFTVTLAASASGIRDAAGNLSSFAATAPSDAAAPARTAMTMLDSNGNGKIDTVTVTFSESLASSSATAPWTLANVPSGGTLASVSTGGNTATLALTEGAGAANTAVGSFTVALAANIAGITDAASNQSLFAATGPTDGAAPVMVSMLMQDSNSNGKVDQLVTTFSETLNSTSPSNTPWTLANVPSGGTKGALAISTSVATLTITEGAGAADTSVGSFTVTLAASASGIRDAAGNQSSFAATAVDDKAAPVPVSISTTDGDGTPEAADTISVKFSESLAALSTTSGTMTLCVNGTFGSCSGGSTQTEVTIGGLASGNFRLTNDNYISAPSFNDRTDTVNGTLALTTTTVTNDTVKFTLSSTPTDSTTTSSNAIISASDPFNPDSTNIKDPSNNGAVGSLSGTQTFKFF